ncbi:MAG: NADH-quinone oxidoreductase subunit L [Nostocoides sp.]
MSAQLWTAIGLPAAVALVILLVQHVPGLGRPAAMTLAVGAGLVSLVALGALAVSGPEAASVRTLPSLDAGLTVPLELSVRGPVLAIALIVALVTLCVQIYSTRYLGQDGRYPVFAAIVALFGSAMQLVVLSQDLVLTVIGWEVMGWCSYLLIGYWSAKPAARRAAHKAFLVTRVADIGFVLGAIALAAGPGNTAYGPVLDYWTGTSSCADAAACAAPSRALLNAGVTLLVIGVLGKSAQLPFQDWLPDAMEGPTPASALIHAATMVAAGTFVLARLYPLIAVAGTARVLLGVSVAVTMVLAGVLAFAQGDLKRLLAWSTVSQVAVMLSPLAATPTEAGAGAGIFHLYAHAFFKALLFLSIGWMGLVGGNTLAISLRGVARRNALVRVGFGFGLLALAGLPFVVGGVSKEHIVSVTYTAATDGDVLALALLIALLTTVVLTAAYAMRAWLVVTSPIGGPAETGSRVPQTPLTLAYAVPLLVLLIGTVFGALALTTPLLQIGVSNDALLTVMTVILVVIGGVLAWFLSAGRLLDPATRLFPRRRAALEAGLGFDRLYRVFTVPVLAMARFVTDVDAALIGATATGVGTVTTGLGRLGDRLHRTSRPATGLVWVLLAALLIAGAGVAAWS